MAKKPLSPLLIAVLIVAILVGSYFLYRHLVAGMPEPAEPTAVTSPTVPSPPPPPIEPDPELPPLDSSDATLREQLGALSNHPRFSGWLRPDDLARRFVRSVDDLSRGQSPALHVRHLTPSGELTTLEKDGKLVIDPASYQRYDRPTEVIASLDTALVVRMYRRLEPLLDEAYRELGYPEGNLEQPMRRAIAQLLATPIPEGDVELVRKVDSYELADPELESLSPGQKHLIRMGPANARKVKAKLRLLQQALGFHRDS